MKNNAYVLNNVRLAVLKFVGVTAISCFVLATILLTSNVSAKTFSANRTGTNLSKLNTLAFNRTPSKNLAKTCSFAAAGSVTYYVCYVACRVARHEISFCNNSCSLIAELPILNESIVNQQEENALPSKSESNVKKGRTSTVKVLTPERLQELKSSGILLEAAMFGDTQTINEMLDFGANANIKVSDFYVGNKNIYDQSAGFTKLEKSYTPLLVAIKYNAEIEAIRLLLNRGADVNVETESGKTALKLATENGREDIVQLLMESGAK